MQNAFEVKKNGTVISKVTNSGEVYDKDGNLRIMESGTLDGGRITWDRVGSILIINVKGHLYNATSGNWLRDVILPYNVKLGYAAATAGLYLAWLGVGEDNGQPKLMFRCDHATNQNIYGQIIAVIDES